MFEEKPVGLGVNLMGTAPVMVILIEVFEGDAIQPFGILAALLSVIGIAMPNTAAF